MSKRLRIDLTKFFTACQILSFMVANEWRTVLCLSRITGHPGLMCRTEPLAFLIDKSKLLSCELGRMAHEEQPRHQPRNSLIAQCICLELRLALVHRISGPRSRLSRFSQNVKPGSCQSQCSNRSR